MFAFLRSNLYPASIAQNPELRGRIHDIRFGLVSSTTKMRANVNTGKPPLCEIERDPVVLSEILLKELKFCSRAIQFVRSIANNYHKAVFTDVDNIVDATTLTDLDELEAQKLGQDASFQEPDDYSYTCNQAHSTRLMKDAYDIHCNFVSLCDSIGGIKNIDMITNADLHATKDPELFERIHAHIAMSDNDTVSAYFISICDISRATWNMMTIMAAANLYHYYYIFNQHLQMQPNVATPRSNINHPFADPADTVFANFPVSQ